MLDNGSDTTWQNKSRQMAFRANNGQRDKITNVVVKQVWRFHLLYLFTVVE